MPICPEPGCGRELKFNRAITTLGLTDVPRYICTASEDQHRIAALEAELAATRKDLEEADRALTNECTCPAQWHSAFQAAIGRQAARRLGKTGEGE